MPRQKRVVISLSILMLASLACKAVSGLSSPQSGIPSVLTEVVSTMVPEVVSPADPTSAPQSDAPADGKGLGIALEKIKAVMEASKQFTFSDVTVNGKPAVLAKLTDSAATAMPAGGYFQAAFIGDPADLSEIRINVPYSQDQSVIDSGLGMVTVLFASILPGDVLFSFLQWLQENYVKVPDGGTQELCSGKFKFVLSRTGTEMLLDIIPAQ